MAKQPVEATWNESRDVWESKHSDVYSETFPHWGTIRHGELCEQATPDFLTDARESLSLLPTPTASRQDSDLSLETWLERAYRLKLNSPPPFTESGVGTPDHEDEGSAEEHLVRYGPYAEAIARAEAIYGPTPEPLVDGRLNPKFSEWSMGWTPGWASDVPGIAASDALKITGNGVAPPQAELAIRTLLGRLNAG